MTFTLQQFISIRTIIPVIIGTVLVIIAVFNRRNYKRLKRSGVPTIGTVTHWKEEIVAGYKGQHRPQQVYDISFNMQYGEAITVKLTLVMDNPPYQVGDRLEILYDPFQPQMYIAGDDTGPGAPSAYKGPLIFAVLAFAFALAQVMKDA